MDRQIASARRISLRITSEPLAGTLSSSSMLTAARLA
jgi:hypothetical protein